MEFSLSEYVWSLCCTERGREYFKNMISLILEKINPPKRPKRNRNSYTTSSRRECVGAICLTRVVCSEGWGLLIFDWFILSMRMEVILDSSFRPPGFSLGSAPIPGGGKIKERSGTGLPSAIRYALYRDPGHVPTAL